MKSFLIAINDAKAASQTETEKLLIDSNVNSSQADLAQNVNSDSNDISTHFSNSLNNGSNNDEETVLITRQDEFRIRKSRAFGAFMYLADVFLSILIFSPIVAFYWYGTWTFLDTYFIPDNKKLSIFLCWLIGLFILMPSYLFQIELQNLYDYFKTLNKLGVVLRFIMRIIQSYIISFAILFQWRGLWNLIDLYFFTDIVSQLSFGIISIAFFSLSRATRTLISTPFLLFIDDTNGFFKSEASRHRVRSVSSYTQYFIDFSITEIIECTANVLAWRGFQNFFDQRIFPNDKFYCIIASFTMSHAVFLLISFCQTFIYKKFCKFDLFYRLVAENLIHILIFLSSVLAWKFYWDVISTYINPPNIDQLYLLIIFHFGSFVLAAILRIMTLLVGPGTYYMDGDISNDANGYFEISYLSTIFKKRIDSGVNERNEAANEI